ncbi:MAG: hypothetical protein Q7T04_04555 [Dehalococcoidia bacterium]|nr:hypothetical protein [Dehalococcoidia bacterium]
MTSLSSLIEKQFAGERLGAIREVAERAAGQGLRVYLVGGVVRDLLLGRQIVDIDIVVEGDALALARALAETKGWQITGHQRFGTAKLRRDGTTLDLATARLETYSKPGTLPDVRPGAIADDLRRRDFTINTMAIEVTPTHFGDIIDTHGGQADLRQKLVRILHPQSFIDDPTRIFRAIRYEQRLGFRLEAETEKLLRRDVSWLGQVSGDRLRHELELVLKEEAPETALRRAGDLGVLREVHPGLAGNGWLTERFESARRNGSASTGLYLALLAYPPQADVESLIARLRLRREVARVLRDTQALRRDLQGLAHPEMRPSAAYALLQRYSMIAVRACLLASDDCLVKERLTKYLDEWRYVKSLLTGDALGKLGVPKGEGVGQVLEELRRARLDGEVETVEQEMALVRKWLETH